MNKIKNRFALLKEKYIRIKEKMKINPKYQKFIPWAIMAVCIPILYTLSVVKNEQSTRVVVQKEGISFQGGRTVGDSKTIHHRQRELTNKRLDFLEKGLKELSEAMQNFLKANSPTTQGEDQSSKTEIQNLPKEEIKETPLQNQENEEVTFSESPSSLRTGTVNPYTESSSPPPVSRRKTFVREVARGPSIISFPVQSKGSPQAEMTVKVPAGSYLKAKLLTGVEASESRPVPVLLQADFFFVGPNKSKIDLSGCFIIAKSQGNLSIERVEMQADKISCVSKSGKMFERELNGFMADGKDSSFGITGLVNSKQSRVASMAFLSSIVQGIGNAIQQAQTSTQTNALGGSNSIVTGDQAKYMAAGGVGNAASLVTNWYLQHAQNLLPTIHIGSGQDVWIILQDTVDLPNWYFEKAKNPQAVGSYSYLSRLVD